MRRVAQSKRNAVQRGSAGGARDSKWAKERREKGERQIPGELISHRSHCICAIKEITASDEGKLQRDMYHFPLHCERWITGSTEQREWEAALARMWGDILKCSPDNLLQKRICVKSYWTLTLSYQKEKKNKWSSHHNTRSYILNQFYLLGEITFSTARFMQTQSDSSCSFEENLPHMLQSKQALRQEKGAERPPSDCKVIGSIAAIAMCSSSGQYQWLCIFLACCLVVFLCFLLLPI